MNVMAENMGKTFLLNNVPQSLVSQQKTGELVATALHSRISLSCPHLPQPHKTLWHHLILLVG